MTNKKIQQIVNLFLGWRLAEDFQPDAGISFAREINGQPRPKDWCPVGTNLLNAADLELCKELYELSGWYTNRRWCKIPEDDGTITHEVVKTGEHIYRNGVSVGGVISPAYDCGYLLRKLPTHTQVRTYYGYHHEPEISEDECGSYAYYDYPQGRFNLYGTNPENALCRLAIELFKKGILTKE